MPEKDATKYNSLFIELGWCMPAAIYALLTNVDVCKIEAYSNFHRSSYRNQCRIGAPNKSLTLSLPIKGGRHYHDAYSDVEIDRSESWAKEHLHSFKSAYMASPFFEHYLPEVEKLLFAQDKLLFDYNILWHNWLLDVLKIDRGHELSTFYSHEISSDCLDLRSAVKFNHTLYSTSQSSYFQTFDNVHGFRAQLSILDCLFHLGPRAKDYLLDFGFNILKEIDTL